jgi:hypothetical protein
MSSDPDKTLPINNVVAFSFVVKLRPTLSSPPPPHAASVSKAIGGNAWGDFFINFFI